MLMLFKGFLIIGIYIILAILSALSMFYVAINIGSLSNTNKGVMSFVAYRYISDRADMFSSSSFGLYVYFIQK